MKKNIHILIATLALLFSTSSFSQTLTISSAGTLTSTNWNFDQSTGTLTVTGDAIMLPSVIADALSSTSVSIIGSTTNFNVLVSDAITSTITGSNLTLGSAGNVGNITLSADLTLAGTFTVIGGTFSGTGNINIANGNNVTVSTSSTSTYSGIIRANSSSTTTSSFTKQGNGTLTIAGVQRYTGETVISDGILKLGIDNAINGSSRATIGSSSTSTASLDVTDKNIYIPITVYGYGAGGVNGSIGALTSSTGGDGISTARFSGTVTIGSDVYVGHTFANNIGFTGTISGTSNITIVGNKTVLVSGTNNNFSGNWIVKTANATLFLYAGSLGTGSIDLQQTTSKLYFAGSSNLTIPNSITGAGFIEKGSSSNITLTGANSYTGKTLLSGSNTGELILNRNGGSTISSNNNIELVKGTLRVSSNQSVNNFTISEIGTSNIPKLIIDAAATLIITGTYGYTQNFYYNLTNNGTIEYSSSSNFPGSQITVGAMKNLIINRSAGVTFNKSLTIAGTLTLTAGKISLGNSDLTIDASGLIAGASSTTYISTNGTGKVSKLINNNSSFTFPVGNSAYNPVTITNKSGANETFSANVLDEVYENYNLTTGASTGSVVSGPRVKRTWNIGKTNPGSNNGGVDFIFNWNSGEVTTNPALTTPALYHSSGTAWTKVTTGTVTSTSTSLTFTGYIGTFSPFAIGDDNTTLPVSWLSFEAEKLSDRVLLNWSTASEQNTKDFEVLYSTDATNWTTLGARFAAGNSNTTRQYSYTHNSPLKNSVYNYYRIKQNDLDGQFSYSKIISIIYNEPGADVMAYPNPASDKITVFTSTDEDVRLVNLTGSIVWRAKLTAGRHEVNVAYLPRGVYILQAGNTWRRILLQ